MTTFILILYFAVGIDNGIIERRYATMLACIEGGIDAKARHRNRLIFWNCEERNGEEARSRR